MRPARRPRWRRSPVRPTWPRRPELPEGARRAELEAIWSQVELSVTVDEEVVDPRRLSAAVGTLHLITAWNPRSQRIEPARNVERQSQLDAELDAAGLERWPCEGASPDGSWREEGSAVAGLSREQARQLGAAWGQDAIYEVSPASIFAVWCEDGNVLDVTR